MRPADMRGRLDARRLELGDALEQREGAVSAVSPGDGSGAALESAIGWVAGVLVGPAATAAAVIAVASLGFLMLAGRLPMRRGGSVVLGCFIVFSAGGVANGLLRAAGSFEGTEGTAVAAAAPTYKPTVPVAAPYDPYSGAAVPDQRQADLFD